MISFQDTITHPQSWTQPIISELFRWSYSITRYVCPACKHATTSQTSTPDIPAVMTLSIPPSAPSPTIFDCFADSLNALSTIECPSCHTRLVPDYSFHRIPPILIFYLKRYSNTSVKNRTPVNSPLWFGLPDLFSRCKATLPPENPNYRYTLRAVVSHLGDDPSFGQYHTFIPGRQFAGWQLVCDMHYSKQPANIDPSDTYILIYQREYQFDPSQAYKIVAQSYPASKPLNETPSKSHLPIPASQPNPPPPAQHSLFQLENTFVTSEDFQKLAGKYMYVRSTLVIDVRDTDFHRTYKLPDSLHLPHDQFDKYIEHVRLLVSVFHYSTVLVHCYEGYVSLSLLFPFVLLFVFLFSLSSPPP